MLPLIGLLAPLLAKVVGGVTGIIDKKIVDKDLANELKAGITRQIMEQDHSEIETQIKEQASIIRAEANSASWLARNWRPMLMCLFGVIIANNYIVFPYVNLFCPENAILLPIPTDLWDLLKLGIGGYVVGRSGEKIVKVLKSKTNL